MFLHSLAVFFGFQHSELTLCWIPRPPENQMEEKNWEKEPTLFEKGMNFSLCIQPKKALKIRRAKSRLVCSNACHAGVVFGG